MKVPYTFTVLRYIHDVLSGEFVNIGVVLYSPKAKFLDARFSLHYGRLSKMFSDVNGEHFRKNVRFIQERLQEEGDRLLHQLELEEKSANVRELSARVLPIDDTSLQFSPEGYGVTENPQKILEQLYTRFVEKYHEKSERHSRTDYDVWKIFKKSLEKRSIISNLKPHKIIGKNYEYEFKYCWKNESWHAQQPISFDLLDADDIVEKANSWVGRITSLGDSEEKFKLNVLLGAPQDTKYKTAFGRAQNILNKMPCDHEFIREEEAEEFAEHLRKEIEAYGHN
jgi:hypothetical protein